MGKKEHAPSAYRKIIKASKSGKISINKLIEEARALSEPYYVSLALFGLSIDKRLENKQASQLRIEALNLVEKEKRPWRRSELIISICKTGKGMQISKDIIKLIGQIPEPKAKAEAISGTAKHLGCDNSPELLKLATQIEGYETDSCKPVIKFWAAECPDFEQIMETLGKLKDQQVTIKLLGYMQLQLYRAGTRTTEPIEMAIELAMNRSEKLDNLKYLASQAEDIDTLEAIATAITGLETPLEEASLLSTLAGSADRARQKELALDWFNSAQESLDEIDNSPEAASIRYNLALGLRRLGHEEQAHKNYHLALDGADEKLIARIEKSMNNEPEKKPKPVVSKSNRHVLALYDTYEGGLSPIHIRMIARAAPLCIAYGLDLALIDFPIDNLNSIVNKVATETNVGKEGKYLKELVKENRILLISELDKAGLAVATTSKPEKQKAITLKDASKKANNHPQKRLCVVMGLGRKGLPKKLLDRTDYHAEITGSNVSLETSTAMGIIAQMIGQLKEK